MSAGSVAARRTRLESTPLTMGVQLAHDPVVLLRVAHRAPDPNDVDHEARREEHRQNGEYDPIASVAEKTPMTRP